MTYEETKQILGILKVNYRSSFAGWTREDGEQFLQLWSMLFKETPFPIVKAAVLSIVMESTERWLPTAGMVNERIKKLVLPDAEEEAIRAWDSIRRFIFNYHRDDYREHYGQLSEITRKLVGVSDIANIAMSDQTAVSVERTRFIKDYKALVNKRNETAITQGKLMEIIDKDKVEQITSSSMVMIGGTDENV